MTVVMSTLEWTPREKLKYKLEVCIPRDRKEIFDN